MTDIATERHPLKPFLPNNSRVLMLGSFPPPLKRWSMPFFYPNFTNDMWRIIGLIFFNDKLHFVDQKNKTFHQAEIESFLKQTGIAIFDTATVVRRLKDNASDKFLEVVEPTDLKHLLDQIPQCLAIITTGEKATSVLQLEFGFNQTPKVGTYITFNYKNREIRLYRMPSSSRAYPIKVEKKADAYRTVFKSYFNINP
ncbi:uracil-DNA glycosylase family protein [Bacteroides propionicifaciens]|jgi:G:T/U-mismatch repair DNA glycosylase|uniref:uracil-DNA glycosylase family protein n=1 Tax=Bacteroides propionicifaciens TaxID=392838 RepID=UPI00035E9B15|nr:uracil-DNA glycosylase family protein [Bacteroides propionicifaciens]